MAKDARIFVRMESWLVPLIDEIGRRTGHGRSGAIRYCVMNELQRRRMPLPDEVVPLDTQKAGKGPSGAVA